MNVHRKAAKKVWVAIRVERGFITEARVFRSLTPAERIEQKWRAKANPDYDESAVLAARL